MLELFKRNGDLEKEPVMVVTSEEFTDLEKLVKSLEKRIEVLEKLGQEKPEKIKRLQGELNGIGKRTKS